MKDLFGGIVQVKKDGEWYIPVRFTDSQLQSYAIAESSRIRSLSPSGCKLEFYSKAKSLEFNYRIGGKARRWAAFDVWENGMFKNTISVNDDNGHVRFVLSGDESIKVEIFLPHLVELAIKDIKADMPLNPVEKKEKLWMCLGDSVTQGMDAVNPSLTYPVLASKLMQYDVLNMGVGGAAFCMENLDYIGREPDLITVSFGSNDWGKVKDANELKHNVGCYLERLTTLYSTRNIFGILPTWRSDADTMRSFMTFPEMRRVIAEEYKKYPFIKVLDGMALVPAITMFYGDAGDLKAHPNEKGFLYFSMKLVNEIKDR